MQAPAEHEWLGKNSGTLWGRKAGGYLHKHQVILVANQQDGLSGAVLTGLTGLKANGNQVPGYTLTVSQFYLNVHYCTDDSTTMQITVN